MPATTIANLNSGDSGLAATDRIPIQRSTANFYITPSGILNYVLTQTATPISFTGSVAAVGLTSSTTLIVSGATTLSSATLSSTLGVTGATTLTSATLSSTLSVTGATTLTALSASTSTTTPLEIVGGVGTDGTNAPTAGVLRAPSAGGTADKTGADLILQAGNGTGTGGSGKFTVQIAKPGSTGSTADTLSTALQIDNNGIATDGQSGAVGNYMLRSGTYQQVGASSSNAPTSSTTFDFTGIPAWAKRVTISLGGVSINSAAGTAKLLLQIGTSSGMVTTGYASNAGAIGAIANTCISAGGVTGGFILTAYPGNTNGVYSGAVVLTRMAPSGGTSGWCSSGTLGDTANNTACSTSGGYIVLSADLDRVRLTLTSTPTGAAFSTGTVNILYE